MKDRRDRSVRIDICKKRESLQQTSSKTSCPSTSSSIYWSILKTFTINKKMSLTPRLLINNKLESGFKKKGNHFNNFLASKCLPVSYDSALSMPVNFNSTTSLNEINFNDEDLLKIIQGYDINKAHGHDNLSVRIIKRCDSEIIGPLSIILKNCIAPGIFPDIWKKAINVPVHKNGDKQIVDNYRPIALLPIIGKIL